MSKKERLDQILVSQGLCDSRAKAQGLIMGGKVKIDGVRVDKPGASVDLEKVLSGKLTLEVDSGPAYVSRGGLKLKKALETFDLTVTNRICMDVGASTGGFTDCLLQHGATRVISVDVGHGQLDWKLRQDQRVRVLEKTNIRHLTPEDLNQPDISLTVMDVSFISLKKTLPTAAMLMNLTDETPSTEIIALIKPQFEYKDYIKPGGGKKFDGVVKDTEEHRQILTGLLNDLTELMPGWNWLGLVDSETPGPKGNREFLLYGVFGEKNQDIPTIEDLIRQALPKAL
ncbi:MAG: TlyA family RNA methyltransferase [Vampirovibrio sp.]|nr:TlyA family RNA methyltransferase [Vampirovibrio sp.]